MSDIEKPVLRSANDNPWYCLATVHGEQPVKGYDDELAIKNRQGWNRWMAAALSDEERTHASKIGFPASPLEPFSLEEKKELCLAFARRTGRENGQPPDPRDTADFSFTDFDRFVTLDFFLFKRASFRSATFSRASFHWATFFDNADFNSASFSDDANFISANFSRNADFNAATFSGDANFISATFTIFGFTIFRSATFSGNADFHSATFSSSASFDSATFSGPASFTSATFAGNADFHSATFSKYASFDSAKFSYANFSSATFSYLLIFLNTKFASQTDFSSSKFLASVPDFRGATMHEATEWHGASWPNSPQDRVQAQKQIYAYERLKQEMERLKKHEDEQMFFRKELRARRGLTRPLSGAWLLNLFYEVLSDYGQSVGRPLLWMVVCFAVGFFIFQGTHVFNGTHLARAAAAALSFANIFSFLPIRREVMTDEMIKGLSYAAQIIGVVQSLLGAILLFLLGLALRNRFRMK